MPVRAYAVGCKAKRNLTSGIKTIRRLLPNGNIVTFVIGNTNKCGKASVIVENSKPKPCRKSGAVRSRTGQCIMKKSDKSKSKSKSMSMYKPKPKSKSQK